MACEKCVQGIRASYNIMCAFSNTSSLMNPESEFRTVFDLESKEAAKKKKSKGCLFYNRISANKIAFDVNMCLTGHRKALH